MSNRILWLLLFGLTWMVAYYAGQGVMSVASVVVLSLALTTVALILYFLDGTVDQVRREGRDDHE